MALLFRHILTIDPTMTMEDTTKDSWNRHPALTDWLAKHTRSTQYTFQIKKCSLWTRVGACSTCLSPRLPGNIFDSLNWLSEPEPSVENAGPYKTFHELYRKTQPDVFKHVPSLAQGRENVDGRGVFQLKNLKGCIQCSHCSKPRCICREVKGRHNWFLIVTLLEEILTNRSITCNKVVCFTCASVVTCLV